MPRSAKPLEPLLPVAWSSLAMEHRKHHDDVVRDQVVKLDAETPHQLSPDTEVGRRVHHGRPHLGKLQGQRDHSIDVSDEGLAQARPPSLVVRDRLLVLIERFAEKSVALHSPRTARSLVATRW